MTPFSKPLIALSLTEPDEGLLRYAAKLARAFDWRDVHFLHVAAPGNPKGEDLQVIQGRMRAEVERVFGEPPAGCKLAFHAAEGSRLDHILGEVVDNQRDLILLGHRKMRSGRRSLARRAAMVAPCSVWLVPEGAPAEISGILVPTDFSSHSADALSVAVKIARATGVAQCQALHVYFDPSTVRFDEHLDEILGQEEQAFKEFLASVDTLGVEVEAMFHESTHPCQAILRIAERSGTDLIVMNTRGRSQAASVLLGSTTSETITETTVPILAVKHFGSRMTLLDALVSHRLWDKESPKTN